MKRLALAAAVAAAGALAAMPAAATAGPPESPPLCILVSTNEICVDDLPQVIGDPGGTITRLVCYGDVRICE